MASVQSVRTNNLYQVNFRADDRQTRPNDPPMLVRNQKADSFEKEKKKQKRRNNIITGVSVASGIAIIAMVLAQFGVFKGANKSQQKELGYLMEEDFKAMIKDFTGEKSFEEMQLPPKLKQKLLEIKDKIAREGIYKDMKLPSNTKAMLLYGPPGTGKNTFTYALAKMFPDAMLFEMDMTRIAAPYYGVPEKNLQNATNYALKLAADLKAKDPNKKLIIFLDEIDRILLQDSGNGAKHSNDILTEFKRCFNSLKKCDNVTIIGATNKEIDATIGRLEGTGVLDEAMLNRFGDKIKVERPIPEAVATSIAEHFKGAKRIDAELLDAKNPKLMEFCNIVTGDKHKFSFRTLEDNIYDKIVPPDKGNLTIGEFVDAAINSKEAIFLEDSEIEALKKLKTK